MLSKASFLEVVKSHCKRIKWKAFADNKRNVFEKKCFGKDRKHWGEKKNMLVADCFLASLLPLTSAEACEKSSWWLWKENCVSTGVRKPGKTCTSQPP